MDIQLAYADTTIQPTRAFHPSDDVISDHANILDQPNSPVSVIALGGLAVSAVLLGEIRPGWSLIKTLQIDFDVEDDGLILAFDNEFFMYGSGQSVEDAMDDYINSLIEYYQVVERSSRGHIPSRGLLEKLQNYLVNIG